MDRRVERIESSISSFMKTLEANEQAASARAIETRRDIKSQIKWNIGIAVSIVLSLAALFQWSSSTAIDVSKIINGYNTEKINEVKNKQDDMNQKINSIIKERTANTKEQPRTVQPDAVKHDKPNN
uniref:hypothetical protein n=1 Tax=Edwardsiella tarda TaxID=636 RepID=UPI0005525B25|nr:hypothetical protein [Edwardsiella tarda]